MRVVVVSLMICALSFAAGVAGDLSLAAQPALSSTASARLVLPADAVRAHPLPPLERAAVRVRRASARTIEVIAIVAAPLDKPRLEGLTPAPRTGPLYATKTAKDQLV